MKLTESTILLSDQKKLEDLIQTKIIHVLGGRKSNATNDNHIRFYIAAQFLHDFYEYFNIFGYSEIKINEHNKAVQYVVDWKPSMNDIMMIKEVNSTLVKNQ